MKSNADLPPVSCYNNLAWAFIRPHDFHPPGCCWLSTWTLSIIYSCAQLILLSLLWHSISCGRDKKGVNENKSNKNKQKWWGTKEKRFLFAQEVMQKATLIKRMRKREWQANIIHTLSWSGTSMVEKAHFSLRVSASEPKRDMEISTSRGKLLHAKGCIVM